MLIKETIIELMLSFTHWLDLSRVILKVNNSKRNHQVADQTIKLLEIPFPYLFHILYFFLITHFCLSLTDYTKIILQ